MAKREKGRQIFAARTVPHDEQRYETCGDWDENGNVSVSELGNWKYEVLIAVHEVIEMALCRAHGVSESAVTEFDKAYERARPEGDTSEPGDHPKAPYRRQHKFATILEMYLAQELGVNWNEYNRAVVALSQPAPKTAPKTDETEKSDEAHVTE